MTQFSLAKFPLDRRSLFKSTGALVVSIGLPGGFAAAAPGAALKPPLAPDQLDSWLAIKSDGNVVAYFGKMDMGQGVDVAIAQIVAEELDVPLARVGVVMGDTALTVNQGGASGSTGCRRAASPCATPRPRRAACSSTWRLSGSASPPTGSKSPTAASP